MQRIRLRGKVKTEDMLRLGLEDARPLLLRGKRTTVASCQGAKDDQGPGTIRSDPQEENAGKWGHSPQAISESRNEWWCYVIRMAWVGVWCQILWDQWRSWTWLWIVESDSFAAHPLEGPALFFHCFLAISLSESIVLLALWRCSRFFYLTVCLSSLLNHA